MSRRRKHETPEHRRERERQAAKAKRARKRTAAARWKRAFELYQQALRMNRRGHRVRLIWHHVPRSWSRRIRIVIREQMGWRRRTKTVRTA